MEGDTDAALDFLRRWHGETARIVITIDPITEATRRRDFVPGEEAAMRAYIDATQGRLNCYTPVNCAGPGASTPTKKEMVAARGLHVDADLKDVGLDAESALARLRRFDPPPTAIIFSGGGHWPLWKFAAPYNGSADWRDKIERVNEGLHKAAGANPTCRNVNRLMRLPGTINVLSKKKRAAGREPALAYVVEAKWDRTLSFERDPVPRLPENYAEPVLDGIDIVTSTSTALEGSARPSDECRTAADLPVKWRRLAESGDARDYRNDRSALVFAFILALLRRGWAGDDVMPFLTEERWGMSAHCRSQSNPVATARRQIERARARLQEDVRRASDEIAELNEKHALILIGDKAAVLREAISTGGEPEIRLLATAAFKQWFAPRHVTVNEKSIPLADYWLQHPQRRHYEGLVFEPGRDVPGYYNLWRGFAVEPGSGDCSKFLAHLKDNACGGNEELSRWVLGWFAAIFQRPAEKVGTSLVFRGKQGTGKTKIGEVIGSLLGDHYVLVADPRYITGHFNSHLVSCLLLHADEGFWAGDRAAEGKLKDLITGKTHLIEFKGKEPVRVRNHVRLFVTGNPDWLVPAGMEERRFAVLEMGEKQMENHPYFAAIDEEMNNGGKGALLRHLLEFDLSSVNLRKIPRTAALVEQKVLSMTPEYAWWLDFLRKGYLPFGHDDPNTCPAQFLFEDYIRHANQQGVRRRSIETMIGMRMRQMVPKKEFRCYETSYAGCGGVEETGKAYRFPPLEKCRQHFNKLMQHEFQWGDDPEDSDAEGNGDQFWRKRRAIDPGVPF